MTAVRWLLNHGAKLSLDKYGKSPINDAAENQQVECLNVLVQHGTAPDYPDSAAATKQKRSSKKQSSNNYNSQKSNRNTMMSKSSTGSSDSEPFYLHPPTIRQTKVNS